MHSWASAKQPGRGARGVTKTQVGTWHPVPMSLPSCCVAAPQGPASERDVFGSTKRGVRGRQGAEGGEFKL